MRKIVYFVIMMLCLPSCSSCDGRTTEEKVQDTLEKAMKEKEQKEKQRQKDEERYIRIMRGERVDDDE